MVVQANSPADKSARKREERKQADAGRTGGAKQEETARFQVEVTKAVLS